MKHILNMRDSGIDPDSVDDINEPALEQDYATNNFNKMMEPGSIFDPGLCEQYKAGNIRFAHFG